MKSDNIYIEIIKHSNWHIVGIEELLAVVVFTVTSPVWADFLEAEMKNVEGMAATCALKPVA